VIAERGEDKSWGQKKSYVLDRRGEIFLERMEGARRGGPEEMHGGKGRRED